ncbi:MAG: GAF domain-containing protein [Candidatus Anammoxibacter sp.]
MSRPDDTVKSLDQTLKIGIFQIEPDVEGKIKFINKFGANLLGYDSPDEIIGCKFSGYFADIKLFKEWFNCTEKSDDEFTTSCLMKDGQEVTVCLSKSSVKDSKGNVSRVDGFIRNIHENKEEALEKEIIANINETLISDLDIHNVYQKICKELRRKIDWDRVSIVLLEMKGSGALNFLVTIGNEKSAVSKALGAKGRFPLIGSILEKVVRTGKPVVAKDTTQNVNETDKIFAKDGLRSRLAYPLKSRSKVIGSVNFSCKQVDYYNEKHIKLLDKVVPSIAIAIENTKLYIRATKSEQEYKELFKTIDSPWL